MRQFLHIVLRFTPTSTWRPFEPLLVGRRPTYTLHPHHGTSRRTMLTDPVNHNTCTCRRAMGVGRTQWRGEGVLAFHGHKGLPSCPRSHTLIPSGVGSIQGVCVGRRPAHIPAIEPLFLVCCFSVCQVPLVSGAGPMPTNGPQDPPTHCAARSVCRTSGTSYDAPVAHTCRGFAPVS